MTVLLVSGMGPEYPDNKLLRHSSFETLLDPDADVLTSGKHAFDLATLRYRTSNGLELPLLRARRDGGGARSVSVLTAEVTPRPASALHLTTFTLESILARAGIEFDMLSTPHIWKGTGAEPTGRYDTILLSTTFIWDRRTLRQAITWIEQRFPEATLILGGQYSNLKFDQIMRDHRFVDFIVRGDAELALPDLLGKLRTGADFGDVPNLVFRGTDGRLRFTPIMYIDIDENPSPSPNGYSPVVPYESMRGCPFSCKYCSFPAASPQWRYKSADKIVRDWAGYKSQNGAAYIKALDSTFTVPPTRLREFLPKVAAIDIQWEAYTRANSIKDAELVRQLEGAGCRSLFLGFESMSDTTLQYMDKKVTSRANRVAYELLNESKIKHFVSFIVGYPGESPELFEDTKMFLVNEFTGEFALYVCMLQDETMPVWQDAKRFDLQVNDPSGEARIWSHCGMDSETAARLQLETLRDVRWKNDNAIFRSWQHEFESPLMSGKSQQENALVEKMIDRLGMISADIEDEGQARRLEDRLIHELDACGVTISQGDKLFC